MNLRTASFRAPNASVAGRRLWEEIVADPAEPLVAGIQGVGGQGKTVLLGALAQAYREAGVPVVDATCPRFDTSSAVLVDDAQRLSTSVLRRITAYAATPGARLLIAYRPWPRRPAFRELLDELGQHGPPVLLEGLARGELAEHLVDAIGTAPSGLVDRVWTLTAGNARLVARVLPTVRAGIESSWELPRAIAEQFHADLDQLDQRERNCLLALVLGAGANPGTVADVLGCAEREAEAVLTGVRASGLLDAQGRPIPVVRQAMLALTSAESRFAVWRQVVLSRLRLGISVLGLVRPALTANVPSDGDVELAPVFEKAAQEALAGNPELAVELFDRAVRAGVDPARVVARRACAALGAGRLDEALRWADESIANSAVPDRDLAVRVTAAVLAHRGLLGRVGELCEWSIAHAPWAGVRAFAVVSALGTGQLDRARRLRDASCDAGPPTSSSGAASDVITGLWESVTGASDAALATLVRAASLSEAWGAETLLPDSPAAIATIFALHRGEFELAKSLVDKMESLSPAPLLRVRHAVLAGWVELYRGDPRAARERLAAVDSETLSARDDLLAVGLAAALANRDNDMAGLRGLRGRARAAVTGHGVDLFTLLPLGELAVALARLREHAWLAPALRQAHQLLDDLGNPPLWTALPLWKQVHAAGVLEDSEAMREPVAALERAAGDNPLSAALARGARSWLAVLIGDVRPQEVEAAARELEATGLGDEGARLAGQAAVRTTDRKGMASLLECARALRGKAPRPRAITDLPQGQAVLSEREREVAELVVSGLTYKQVGQRLFISAKTVEHHVGRIKQRLGCAKRSELLAALRDLFDRS